MVEVTGLTKSFKQGDEVIPVLRDLTFSVNAGETLALVGPSGSGKSTVLSLLAGLDHPDSGTLRIADQDLVTMGERELTRFRARTIGIVFQQFYLFSHLTALENVMLPLEILNGDEVEEKARAALRQVGLDHRVRHFPHQLSGGESQRVAIARAFVVKPKLLLADEPSGSLDHRTGDEVIELLFELVANEKTTLILVTHNQLLAERCGRVLHLDGL